jgi:hypothetical protein
VHQENLENVEEKVAFMRQQQFFDIVKISDDVKRYMNR